MSTKCDLNICSHLVEKLACVGWMLMMRRDSRLNEFTFCVKDLKKNIFCSKKIFYYTCIFFLLLFVCFAL